MTKEKINEAQTETSKSLKEISKHPLVLLLVGTLLGSLIIPQLREREANERELADLRSQKAFAAFSANQGVDADLNGMTTGFENLLKARVQTLDSPRDLDLQRQIDTHHAAFNRDAWWWFPQLITEAEIFGILEPNSASEARSLAKRYDANLIATSTALEPFWFLMESKPALSPPDKLDHLLRQIHDSNKRMAEDRLQIVSAFAGLLLKRHLDDHQLKGSGVPPNPARSSGRRSRRSAAITLYGQRQSGV